MPALAPALRSSNRLTLGETGVVLAAVAIGLLPMLLPWGLAADPVGECAVLVTSLDAAAVALAATGSTGASAASPPGLVAAGVSGASVSAASGRAVMG
ncbi:MAG: hypothetical protein ABR569_07770 [Gaiellaceae bacterium]